MNLKKVPNIFFIQPYKHKLIPMLSNFNYESYSTLHCLVYVISNLFSEKLIHKN